MDKGFVQVFCGTGRGKSSVAVGQGIRAASHGKSVIIIQFLKEKNEDRISFVKRLEPEVKLFRFEKSEESFENLSEEEKKEETMNLINGLNFAKKVLVTGECNVLILDEVLGLLDHKIVTPDDIRVLIDAKDEETELVLTGIHYNGELDSAVDEVTRLETEKKQKTIVDKVF